MSYYLLGYIIRFSGLWNNANYYGQQVNLAIAIILGSYFKREIKPNLLDICILGALVLLGIMTLSRSFLYVFLFMSIFYFIAIIKSLNNMRLGNRIAIVLVLLLFIIMTCSLAFNSISSRRGLVSSNEDILAGRLTNSNIIIDRFISYNDPILILFGFGAMNSYKYINTLEATDILNTHNTYFDLLTDFGIVGLIFVSAIFIKYFSNIRGFKILDGDNLYLLVILISAFVMSYLLTDYIYYLLALCGFYRNDQESVMQNSRIVATKA